MNRKWDLLLLLLFVQLQALTAQSDSLLVMFRNAPDEKAAADIANKICSRCDSSITCYTPFITLLQEPPVTIQKVRGLFIVANTLFRFNHNAWLIRLLQSGISASKSLDPQLPILGNYYATLCNTYKFTNVLDSALFYADLAEQSYQYHQQENAYWKPDHLRYQIYLELKDFKKADAYIHKAYDLVRDSPNRADKGFVLYNLLEALHNRGTQVEFEFYLDEFLRFKAQGSTNSLDGRHLGLTEFFDDSEEATEILEKRLALALADTIHYTLDLTRLALSSRYQAVGKYEQALQQLDAVTASSNNSITAQKERYHQYYEIYKKLNKPNEAYAAIERYQSLQDSSYQELMGRSIADYEVKYQTQLKEKEIVTKDLALTKARNTKQSLFGLSGFLGFALLGGIILHRRKLKFQQEISSKENELQTQKIKELEQKNILLSLNSIIEGQESERLRIAQDLHDGLGGLLTTVKAHFNSIQKEMENIKNLNVYEKTNQLIDEACVEVRRIAHDMVPYSIKISGISGAIEDLKESIVARGLQCEVEVHHLQEDMLSEQKANMIYRIIQEITNNTIRHASASKILIQLMQHEKSLHLLVEDNGKGFDINEVVSNKGMGLKSIDSRVKYLGGTINFDTAPGLGTAVNIEIPL